MNEFQFKVLDLVITYICFSLHSQRHCGNLFLPEWESANVPINQVYVFT